MDIVITYVDGRDPLWQADYAAVVPERPLPKRFRDWGTLPYLLRGIERHIGFVRRVFLVVARESQVPAWIDPAAVTVVLHRDFIPAHFLPLFNASSIELFLHRIPGLGERFLYFNDDCFPLGDFSEADFYTDKGIALGYTRQLFACNAFQRQVRKACRIAAAAASPLRQQGLGYVRPQHCCTPMFRPDGERLYRTTLEPLLPQLVSPVRAEGNINQYVFTDYLYHSGRVLRRRISCRHFSLALATPGRIRRFLRNPDRKLVCFNDVAMSNARFVRLQKAMLEGLQARFPQPSRFERGLAAAEA